MKVLASLRLLIYAMPWYFVFIPAAYHSYDTNISRSFFLTRVVNFAAMLACFFELLLMPASVACGGDAMVCGGGGRRYALLCQTQYGHAALILASANGRADCVRLLIDAGADKEAKNNVRHLMIRFPQRFCFLS